MVSSHSIRRSISPGWVRAVREPRTPDFFDSSWIFREQDVYKRQSQYPATIKALEKLIPPYGEALQIAGHTLISDAQSAAVAITPALRDAFGPKTKLASALAGKKRAPTKEEIQ